MPDKEAKKPFDQRHRQLKPTDVCFRGEYRHPTSRASGPFLTRQRHWRPPNIFRRMGLCIFQMSGCRLKSERVSRHHGDQTLSHLAY
jgi:hypothetical protein